MSWTERQTHMLAAMGLRLWTQPQPQPQQIPRLAPVADLLHVPAPVPAPGPAVVAAPAPALVRAPTPASAPLPELAALDWTTLRDTVAACRACGLCDSRKQTVFGTGHPQAHWLIVGEAPGEPEDLAGEPFAGPSGRLLDRMLQALNLTRSADGPEPPAQRAFVAHTVKCRPPRNRNPSAAEFAQCAPFLLRQIELLKPRVILAMGRIAVQALLGSDEPLGRLRGRVHDCRGVPLVVTFEPTYLLRQPQEKARAWEDLCLAADTAETAEIAGAG